MDGEVSLMRSTIILMAVIGTSGKRWSVPCQNSTPSDSEDVGAVWRHGAIGRKLRYDRNASST